MSDMKAIETEYKGYRFRSRLEARWAVFFDEMGIKYEYEPEGIVLSDGTHYLPDFFLPDFNCYFEVKRSGIKGTKEGWTAEKKVSDLRSQDCVGMICYGDPYDNDIFLEAIDCNDSGGGWSASTPVTFDVDDDGDPILVSPWADDERTYFSDNFETLLPIYQGTLYDVSARARRARVKARQARFEHGEKP